MIILQVVNPAMGLSKNIDATNYTKQEMCKTFKVYMQAGYNVYVAKGIEKIVKGLQC